MLRTILSNTVVVSSVMYVIVTMDTIKIEQYNNTEASHNNHTYHLIELTHQAATLYEMVHYSLDHELSQRCSHDRPHRSGTAPTDGQ